MKNIIDLKYIIIDVDGTMTDSSIIFDDKGNELKKFSSRDYIGFRAARYAKIKIIVVTGRECQATLRRMNELCVDDLFQNVRNKGKFVTEYMTKNSIERHQIGYIGDDINDLSAMKNVGFKACPNDACKEVMEIADFISSKRGGDGVITDTLRFLLNMCNRWNSFVEEIETKGY